MRPLAYERAVDASAAVAALAADPGARYLGGGTNLVDHLKLGVAAPSRVVDVSRLPFDRIERREDGGLLVGGAVRNSDLAADQTVRREYPALAQALLAGASGQLRNLATTAGNLLQRTRCPYFQDVTTPCNKRAPGSGCSALGGHTRSHAVLGASEHCIATHPSDMAVALAALDATVLVTGPSGDRELPVTELYRLPGDAPDRDTVLEHGDLITHVALPSVADGTVMAYRKVRDRASYAFALVSVAVVARRDPADGTLRDARIAYGGLAHRPWRATAAEELLADAVVTETAARAAADVELAGAVAQDGNAFKIPLAANLLAAVVRDLEAAP